jgi:hypothetical protein
MNCPMKVDFQLSARGLGSLLRVPLTTLVGYRRASRPEFNAINLCSGSD